MGRLFQPVPWHGAWPITSEPVLGRGADGIPDRLDRVGALGNAVVPQIPELIGNAILQSINHTGSQITECLNSFHIGGLGDV